MVRVGAVTYLNTRPLIHNLTQYAPEIDLVLDVPSQLARDLSAGKIDVGLIPVVEYFRLSQQQPLTILPGSSIASFGPVMSVKLFSNKPFESIKTVALDQGSRTSVALTKIILSMIGLSPSFSTLTMEQDYKETDADAVLLIGDRCMPVRDGEFRFTLDLGYEWSRWTGLPFVWAVWAVRDGVQLSPQVRDGFAKAKQAGRQQIPEIARDEARRLGLDETRCRFYLENVIRHELGTEELLGLDKFRELCVQHQLIPEGVSCVFYGEPDTVTRR